MAEMNPKKQQMEYIAIGVLVLVALFIGISRFGKKGASDEVFSRTEFNKRWEEIKVLEKKVTKLEKTLLEERKSVAYKVDEAKATPFKSPFERKKPVSIEEEVVILPRMNLQGMVWNSRLPQAIIDNKVYTKDDIVVIGTGETAEKVKITDITAEGITIRYKTKYFIVRPMVQLKK